MIFWIILSQASNIDKVNLIGGRAWCYEMFPLVSAELESIDLLRRWSVFSDRSGSYHGENSFAQIAGFDIADDDRIFVLDFKEKKVKIFADSAFLEDLDLLLQFIPHSYTWNFEEMDIIGNNNSPCFHSMSGYPYIIYGQECSIFAKLVFDMAKNF